MELQQPGTHGREGGGSALRNALRCHEAAPWMQSAVSSHAGLNSSKPRSSSRRFPGVTSSADGGAGSGTDAIFLAAMPALGYALSISVALERQPADQAIAAAVRAADGVLWRAAARLCHQQRINTARLWGKRSGRLRGGAF